MLLAEIVAHYFPKLVELHNYRYQSGLAVHDEQQCTVRHAAAATGYVSAFCTNSDNWHKFELRDSSNLLMWQVLSSHR